MRAFDKKEWRHPGKLWLLEGLSTERNRGFGSCFLSDPQKKSRSVI
jgi:hypothetical protein